MSFMLVTGPNPSRGSYGWRHALRQIAAISAMVLIAATVTPAARAETPLHIVALGNSLTAGYGLPGKDGFVSRLQAALTQKGVGAEVVDAGVSGDTASDGLARLDWSVPDGTDAVIVELGANDMLRGIKPEVTRQALDAILRRLAARHIAVMLCGMRAAPISAPIMVRLSSAFIRSSRPNTASCSIPSSSTALPPNVA